MTNKQRKIISISLLTVAIAMLVYGLFLRYVTVISRDGAGESYLRLSEPAVNQDATVGGLVRSNTGRIERTYTGIAPTACPT